MILPNEYKTTTKYYEIIGTAALHGIGCINDMFDILFAEAKEKKSGVLLAELAIAVNYCGWRYYEHGLQEIADILFELYYKVYDYAYGDGNLSQEEVHKYFEITD